MTNSELFSNVQVLLRKAIASRLEMPREEYDSSLDHKNAVNVFLTDVMSIAYNNGNDAAVLEELSTLHHYGEEDTPEVIEFVTKQIIFAKTKLSAEIAAFAKMHEMNQAKMAPEVTWETVQKMVSIAKEYEDCVP